MPTPGYDLGMGPDDEAITEIRARAKSLQDPADLDPLIERVGDARFVLLGEASHGTAEYYRWRALITQRLIEELGFDFVAVEGDWPECFAVNQWVKSRGGRGADATSAEVVLDQFERWPTWMWANTEVARFVDWLKHHNARTGAEVGFYGLDVYSLWESLNVVLEHLKTHDPDQIQAAYEAFACFEPYAEDPQAYARATRMVPASCEDEVVELLAALHRAPVGRTDPEAEFNARQNAEVVVEAERYYRTMIGGGSESWNVRDCHMVDTLDRLMRHHGPGARAVVWEHNTHIGDARATDMARVGMLNVGQVVRERHGADDVVLVGFAGGSGSVIAARSWGMTPEAMSVPTPVPGTHEDLLSQAADGPALFVFPDDRQTPWLGNRRGHRAIGVVYSPARDPLGNWVPTTMGDRYDALLWFDTTQALQPLRHETLARSGEQDTYPWSA